MKRNLGMIVPADSLRAFELDGAVTEGCALGAARDDADVEHSSVFLQRPSRHKD